MAAQNERWESLGAWLKPHIALLLSPIAPSQGKSRPTAASPLAQVCLYAFDCLFLNGETLLQQPLSTRREKLYSALIESPGELWFAEAKA